MTMEQIDDEVRALYRKLVSKKKNYTVGNLSIENGEVVNKCLDLYFKLKEENAQLTLF